MFTDIYYFEVRLKLWAHEKYHSYRDRGNEFSDFALWIILKELNWSSWISCMRSFDRKICHSLHISFLHSLEFLLTSLVWKWNHVPFFCLLQPFSWLDLALIFWMVAASLKTNSYACDFNYFTSWIISITSSILSREKEDDTLLYFRFPGISCWMCLHWF